MRTLPDAIRLIGANYRIDVDVEIAVRTRLLHASFAGPRAPQLAFLGCIARAIAPLPINLIPFTVRRFFLTVRKKFDCNRVRSGITSAP